MLKLTTNTKHRATSLRQLSFLYIVLYCIRLRYCVYEICPLYYAVSSKYVGSPEKDWFM